MRYYYKANDGKGFLNLKTPLENKEGYTQITEDEYNKLTRPPELTEEQKAKLEKARQIAELKKNLADTDYIVLKMAEAIAENDNELLNELKLEYSVKLVQRKEWRYQLNNLE